MSCLHPTVTSLSCCGTDNLPTSVGRNYRLSLFAYFVDSRGIVGTARWLVGSRIVPMIGTGCDEITVWEGERKTGRLVAAVVVVVVVVVVGVWD